MNLEIKSQNVADGYDQPYITDASPQHAMIHEIHRKKGPVFVLIRLK